MKNIKTQTENTKFRSWKSGKTWLFASTAVAAVAGAATIATSSVSADTMSSMPGMNMPSTTTTTSPSTTTTAPSTTTTAPSTTTTAPSTSTTTTTTPSTSTSTSHDMGGMDMGGSTDFGSINLGGKGTSFIGGGGSLINVDLGQSTSTDNNTTNDSSYLNVENSAIVSGSTGTTAGQSNVNADTAIAVDQNSTNNGSKDVTLVANENESLALSILGSANKQVVVSIPKDLTNLVALGQYDLNNLTTLANGNRITNVNGEQVIKDENGRYAVAGDGTMGQVKVTVDVAPEGLRDIQSNVSGSIQSIGNQIASALSGVQSALNNAVGAVANPLGGLSSALKLVGINLGSTQIPSLNLDFNLGSADKAGTVLGELSQALKDVSLESLTKFTTIANAHITTDAAGNQYIQTDNFSGTVTDAITQSLKRGVADVVNALDSINMTYTPLSIPSIAPSWNIGDTVSRLYSFGVNSVINVIAGAVATMINADNEGFKWNVDISGITKTISSALSKIPFVGGTIAAAINGALQQIVNVMAVPLKAVGYVFDTALTAVTKAADTLLTTGEKIVNLIGSVNVGDIQVEVPMQVTSPDMSSYKAGDKLDAQFGVTFTDKGNFVNVINSLQPTDTTGLVYEAINKTRDVQEGSSYYSMFGMDDPEGLEAEVAQATEYLTDHINTTDTRLAAYNQLQASYKHAQEVLSQTNLTQAQIDEAEAALERDFVSFYVLQQVDVAKATGQGLNLDPNVVNNVVNDIQNTETPKADGDFVLDGANLSGLEISKTDDLFSLLGKGFGAVSSLVTTLVKADFPDPIGWVQSAFAQFMKSAYSTDTSGGPGASGTATPTVDELNQMFDEHSLIMNGDYNLLTSFSINNIAKTVFNSVAALAGSVSGIPVAVINGFMNPGEYTQGTVAGQAVKTVQDAFGDLFKAVNTFIKGLILTLLGEIEAPVLSDEPDRLVLSPLAAAFTGINTAIHNVLGAIDVAVGGSPEQQDAVGSLIGVSNLPHAMLGALSGGIDQVTSVLWNVIAAGANLLQIPHPHGDGPMV